MGKMKEIWAIGLVEIEDQIDEITSDYGSILSYSDYIDHLQDYFELDYLKRYEIAIFEHIEFLHWKEENQN